MRDRVRRANIPTPVAILIIAIVIIFFFATMKPAPQTLIKNAYPSYVHQVYPNPFHNNSVMNMICMTINISHGWNQDDSLKKAEQDTNDSLQIKLDGKVIPRSSGRVFIVRDPTISPIYLVQFPISICEATNFVAGKHEVSTSWSPTSDKSYTYEWSFVTDDVTAVDTGAQNNNLLVQYDIWREQVIQN